MIADDFTERLAHVLVSAAFRHPNAPTNGISIDVIEALAVEAVAFIQSATGIRPRWPQTDEEWPPETAPRLGTLTAEELLTLWQRARKAEQALASHGQCERDRDAARAAIGRVHEAVQNLRHKDAVRVLDALNAETLKGR
ncbi:hypothetical protein ACFV1H_17850 [Streptomyces virginiae]|uniref:hypothetical protein n=1 Tax=Streptomyces virginiae TaxID=1961 RepID=UPI0036C650BB